MYLKTIVAVSLLSMNIANALPIDIVDKIDINAIKSISLKKTDDAFKANLIVKFSTTAKMELKFRNTNFKITFKDDNDKSIYFGSTKSELFILPPSKNGNLTFKEQKLEVYIGKNDTKTMDRLIDLFNVIANPETDFEMIISGTTEVGTKAKRGWIYQGQVEIENFTFYPTIQREVLFK
ncbi:hypothetical protein [Candidatus Marithrix sp. Canyon 246]|uniref:hypothetical protein n=1 Tax=Candidatus Marithrix sp. Canyon 246 TaxID=1827136 RepID=UPI00084A22DA|nr:hypothetical protein [Candidatus Marithrix sp. Canyon 246]